MPEKWNDVFIDERIEGVAASLGKSVFIDIGGVTERNKMLNTNLVIFLANPGTAIDESHITKRDIAADVQSYKMEHKSGIGLVFIVDRMVYNRLPTIPNGNNTPSPGRIKYAEAVYVVFF
jgi:hypothetical protein